MISKEILLQRLTLLQEELDQVMEFVNNPECLLVDDEEISSENESIQFNFRKNKKIKLGQYKEIPIQSEETINILPHIPPRVISEYSQEFNNIQSHSSNSTTPYPTVQSMLETKLQKLKDKCKTKSLHSSKDSRSRPSKSAGNSLNLDNSSNFKPNISAQEANRIHQKISQLRDSGNWSLGQKHGFFDPPRPKTHWHYLLDEMELMHVDFVEEKKWKKVVAMILAYEAKKWHELEDKSSICIVPGRKRSQNGAYSISNHFAPLSYQDHYYMSLYEHDIFDSRDITIDGDQSLSSIDATISDGQNQSFDISNTNLQQTSQSNGISNTPTTESLPNQGSINPSSIIPPDAIQQTKKDMLTNIDLPLYYFNPNPGNDLYKNPLNTEYLFPANPFFIRYPLQDEPIGFDGLLSSSGSEDDDRDVSPPVSPLTHPFMSSAKIHDLEESSTSLRHPQLDAKSKLSLASTSRGWDTHMDSLLLKLIGIFSSNWNLISETLNSRVSRSLSKNPKECSTRFEFLSQSSKPPYENEFYRNKLLRSELYQVKPISPDPNHDKRESNFIEIIKKHGIRANKIKSESQSTKNGALHETHETLEKNSSLSNPMEMSIRKSDLDRQLKAAQQQFQRSSNPIVQAQLFSQMPAVQQPAANNVDQTAANPAQQIPMRVQPNLATGSFVRPVPHIGINHGRPLVLPPRSVPPNWPNQPPANIPAATMNVNPNPTANPNATPLQNTTANPNTGQPQAMNVPNNGIPINPYPNAAGLARIPMQNRFTPDQLQYIINNNMMPGIRPGVNVTPAHLAAYMSQFGRINNPLMNTMGQQNPAVNAANLAQQNTNPSTPQQGRPAMAQQINPQAIQLWQLFISGRLPNPTPAQMAVIQQIQLISQRRLQNEIQALSLQGMRPNMSRATPEVKVPMDRSNLSNMSMQNNVEVNPNVNPVNPGVVPMNNLQNNQNVTQMNNNGTPNMNPQ